MLKIRLRRMGSRHRPFYRFVVSDGRKTPTASALEELGYYDPRRDPVALKVDLERVDYWVGVGAQLSETVRQLVKRARTGKAFAIEEATATVAARRAEEAKKSIEDSKKRAAEEAQKVAEEAKKAEQEAAKKAAEEAKAAEKAEADKAKAEKAEAGKGKAEKAEAAADDGDAAKGDAAKGDAAAEASTDGDTEEAKG